MPIDSSIPAAERSSRPAPITDRALLCELPHHVLIREGLAYNWKRVARPSDFMAPSTPRADQSSARETPSPNAIVFTGDALTRALARRPVVRLLVEPESR